MSTFSLSHSRSSIYRCTPLLQLASAAPRASGRAKAPPALSASSGNTPQPQIQPHVPNVCQEKALFPALPHAFPVVRVKAPGKVAAAMNALQENIRFSPTNRLAYHVHLVNRVWSDHQHPHALIARLADGLVSEQVAPIARGESLRYRLSQWNAHPALQGSILTAMQAHVATAAPASIRVRAVQHAPIARRGSLRPRPRHWNASIVQQESLAMRMPVHALIVRRANIL